MNNLITPYQDKLTALIGTPERQAKLKLEARDFASFDLSPRQTADLELLINGGYSPLTGYMNRADYDSVATSMRLVDGTLWPVPIALEVTEKIGAGLTQGERVALRGRVFAQHKRDSLNAVCARFSRRVNHRADLRQITNRNRDGIFHFISADFRLVGRIILLR